MQVCCGNGLVPVALAALRGQYHGGVNAIGAHVDVDACLVSGDEAKV